MTTNKKPDTHQPAPTAKEPPVTVQDIQAQMLEDMEAPYPVPDNLAEKNVYQRVNAAASMLDRRLKKRGKNTFHNYAFTSHDDIVAAVRGPLISCGVHVKMQPRAYTLKLQDGIEGKRQFLCEMELELEIRNVDKPDDFYTVMVPAYAMDTSDKAIGKAISYGKKYGLSAEMGLMLATGEDADTDSPQVPQTRQERPQASAPPRQREKPQSIATTPRQQAPARQEAAQGVTDTPANKEAAEELLARYTEADPDQLGADILLSLCDAMAVKLGCPTGNYATKVALDHTQGKPVAKTNVVKSFNAMQMRHGYWYRLRDNIIAKHEGNEESAKEALKALMAERKWGTHEGDTPVWKIEPSHIAAAVAQFQPAE